MITDSPEYKKEKNLMKEFLLYNSSKDQNNSDQQTSDGGSSPKKGEG